MPSKFFTSTLCNQITAQGFREAGKQTENSTASIIDSIFNVYQVGISSRTLHFVTSVSALSSNLLQPKALTLKKA